jgi:hypothetical protein
VIGKVSKRGDHVILDDIPIGLEEGANESIRTRSLDRRNGEDNLLYFLLCEIHVQVGVVRRLVPKADPINSKLYVRLNAEERSEVVQKQCPSP